MKGIADVILSMALWGSVAAIAVLAVRPFVKKNSHRIMSLLWLVVLFRFLCPIAIESKIPAAWSDKMPDVVNKVAQIDQRKEPQQTLAVQDREYVEKKRNDYVQKQRNGIQEQRRGYVPNTDAKVLDINNTSQTNMVSTSGKEMPDDAWNDDDTNIMSDNNAVEADDSVVLADIKNEDIEDLPTVFASVWLLGAVIFLTLGTRRYYLISKSLRESVFLQRWGKYMVRTSDVSGVPMSFGILHPGIYVPMSFGRNEKNRKGTSFTDRQKNMILWHEAMHLKRHDPLMKLAVYVMFAIHWWNPLVWICVKYINQDIEMACDEMVLAHIGRQNRGEYAETLLNFAARSNGISLMASFGESHAENRIKNALRYRKAPIWVTSVTVLFALGLGGCLTLKPVTDDMKEQTEESAEEQKEDASEDAETTINDVKESLTPLWLKDGEDYITTFPLGEEEAIVRFYNSGEDSYYIMEKDGAIVGQGTLIKYYEIADVYGEFEKYSFREIDEIGYADINFDQLNDLIIIGETQKGKCVYMVESKEGILDKEEPTTGYLTDIDNLSNAMEDLLGEHPTVQGVKDILFGKEYDGTFKTYQDAYEVVAGIENMKSPYSEYDLIYFNDDDIPDLVVDDIGPRLYLFEDGKVYSSNICLKVGDFDGYYIERQSIVCPGDYMSEGEEYDYFQLCPDHTVKKLCGYLVESKASDWKEARLTFVDHTDENRSQDEIRERIEGYKREQKEVFQYLAGYSELLYTLGKLPNARDTQDAIASHVTINDTPQTIDHLRYAQTYMKIIDDMLSEYPEDELKFDLIYFNDDRYPDLVVDCSESWTRLYIYEDGTAIKVWDRKKYDSEEYSKYTYLTRCGIINSYEPSNMTEGKAYILNTKNEMDVLSYSNSDVSCYEYFSYTLDSFLGRDTEWYLNDKVGSEDEIENRIRNHNGTNVYYSEISLNGAESADVMKERLASEMNHKDPDFSVSEDSLYERFKNDSEKVYFNKYDGRNATYGPNFGREMGYTLSELIDTVWLHYKESYWEVSSESTNMLLDFAYLDCGQDGNPEMAIEFKNVGIYSPGDDSTLVLVIKDINGELQCTYGYETWGRSGQTINTAGIIAGEGNGGWCQEGYDLGILDENAEYHEVYYVDTISDTPAEDYFSREDGFIYECEAYINDKTYKFYVSDDSNISADALFRTMKKEYNDLQNAKEVAKIREQTKKDYGITEEMLWMDPLFESTYLGSGNPMEMMNRACGKGFGWD